MNERASGQQVWVFRLPDRVDHTILETLAALIGKQPGTHVLDFAATSHIDFRGMRAFARRVRGMGPLHRPILLAGLNPYCLEIMGFALGAGDNDLFLIAPGGAAGVWSRGNDPAPGLDLVGTLVEDEAGGALRALHQACLN